MRVLHCIPPVKFGGGESILHSLVLMGVETGYEESVCCIYKAVEFERVLTNSKIPWYRLSDVNLGSGPGRIASKFYAFSLLLKMPKFFRIISQSRPDVLHLHGFPSNFLGFLVKSWARVTNAACPRLVYTHHAVSGRKGYIERKIFDRIYRNLDFVTAVSMPSLQSLLKDHPGLNEKACVIQNFASKVFYEIGLGRNLNLSANPPLMTFVNVARFTPVKNHIAVVNAVRELSDSERERIEIVFVGDGETLSEVKAAVLEAKLEKSFEFKGFVPNERVPSLLADSHVMIFPSKNEGSPIAVAEALAAGLPVIGLNTCDAVVDVAGDAGVYVDDDKLVDGIRYILSVDLLEISRKAVARARDFDPELIKQAYLNVYSAVLSGNIKALKELSCK